MPNPEDTKKKLLEKVRRCIWPVPNIVRESDVPLDDQARDLWAFANTHLENAGVFLSPAEGAEESEWAYLSALEKAFNEHDQAVLGCFRGPLAPRQPLA